MWCSVVIKVTTLLGWLAACKSSAGTTMSPLANPAAVVQLGQARFTILTDHVIRMEWAPRGKNYRDEATIVILNRYAEKVPQFQVFRSTASPWVGITTKFLELKYLASAKESFNRTNLQIRLLSPVSGYGSVGWTPGEEDLNHDRFPGTIRTLDGINGAAPLDCVKEGPDSNKKSHCTYGLISKNGYAVVDDTLSREFDDDPVWPWIKRTKNPLPVSAASCLIPLQDRRICGLEVDKQAECEALGCCYAPETFKERYTCYYSSEATQDLYFFGHGKSYKQAIFDFTFLAGKVPLPPRFALGTFYSRYWAFSDVELMNDIVGRYDEHGVPLDNLVIDMDWHLTFYANQTKDQAGEQKGWSGYTWNKSLFPNPKKFLEWCHSRGLRVTLNLHPASGVQPWEDTYKLVAEAMGIDPTTEKYVPFRVTDRKFAETWLNISLGNREAEGIDFWWLDWQQGEDWFFNYDKVPQLSPTLWLNHVFFTNPNRWHNERIEHTHSRPLILHRWGGLGNHRYQVGFSGDVQVSWESLRFQPYFTSMAANVGYAYWSHDLGGHTKATPPELFTRWVQWGSLSPVFRTHCTKDANSYRRIWMYDDYYYEIMRDAMRERYQLVPYIYTQARHTHETGLGLLHGLYYEWPHETSAYNESFYQYMYGEDMMIRPITSPVDEHGLSSVSIWIPPGEWVDLTHGQVLMGPAYVNQTYLLDEVPIFARGGAIIPKKGDELRSSLGQTQKLPKVLWLLILPTITKTSGSGRLYEDDGSSAAYQNGNYSWTEFTWNQSTDSNELFCTEIKIDQVRGSFPSMPRKRSYKVELFLKAPPTEVTLNNNVLPYTPFQINEPTKNSWTYDGARLALLIYVTDSLSVYQRTIVQVKHDKKERVCLKNGAKRLFSRLKKAKRLLDDQWRIKTVFMDYYPNLMTVYGTDQRITYDPSSFCSEMSEIIPRICAAMKEITNLPNLNPEVKAQLIGLIPHSECSSVDQAKLSNIPGVHKHTRIIATSFRASSVATFLRYIRRRA